MKKKTNQISVRLPEELQEALDRVCKLTGLDATTVTRACLQAFVEEVDRAGEIRLPLAVIPKKEVQGGKWGAAAHKQDVAPAAEKTAHRRASRAAASESASDPQSSSIRGLGPKDLEALRPSGEDPKSSRSHADKSV